MKRTLSMACLAMAGSLSCAIAHAQSSNTTADAQFLSQYPACDYEVIDVVTLSGHLPDRAVTNEIDQENQKILQRLQQAATESGADAIALIDRKVQLSGHRNNRLWLTAEFIRSCDDKPGVVREMTPVAPDGAVQVDFGVTVKTKIGREMTIELNTNDAQPDISSRKVDLQQGVYGINPGDSVEKVLETFGTPSFIFSPLRDWKVMSYGRNHWLTFHDSELKKISTESDFFRYRLLNEIPFDDRFDERRWELLGKYEKGQKLEQAEYKKLAQGKQQEGQRLTALTDEYLANNQEYRTVNLNGFELSNQAFSFPDGMLTSVYDANNQFLTFLASLLDAENTQNSVTISAIPSAPFGESKIDRGTRLYLYDGHTAVSAIGDTISKVLVEPELIQFGDTPAQPWKFMSFYYGQPLNEALDIAGSDAFHYRDYIEIDRGDYMIKLFLTGEKDAETVYAMELDIYF